MSTIAFYGRLVGVTTAVINLKKKANVEGMMLSQGVEVSGKPTNDW